jgi:hypothetical protein
MLIRAKGGFHESGMSRRWGSNHNAHDVGIRPDFIQVSCPARAGIFSDEVGVLVQVLHSDGMEDP